MLVTVVSVPAGLAGARDEIVEQLIFTLQAR